MTEEHKGDPVTRLNAGNQIRALGGLLDDIDRNPTHHITGLYDRQTADLVKPIQVVAATAANGVVDQVTWRLLRQRACGTYDY